MLALVLAASPSVTVVLSSNRFGADAFAARVSAAVQQSLVAHGTERVAAGESAAACEAKLQCLGQRAAALGTDAVVVGVDVTKIVKSLAIHVDAVNASGEVLASLDVATPIDGWLRQLAQPLEAFSAMLAKKLSPPPAVSPVVEAPPPLVVPPAVVRREGADPLPWVAAAAALASGAATVTFWLSSDAAVSRYQQTMEQQLGAVGSTLSLGEVERLRGAANTRANVALFFGAVTAALVVVTLVLFLR